jgi:hypothetical protein
MNLKQLERYLQVNLFGKGPSSCEKGISINSVSTNSTYGMYNIIHGYCLVLVLFCSSILPQVHKHTAGL